MPVAVAWIGGIIAGGGIGAALATAAINLLTSTAISYGLSRLNRPKEPKPRDLQTQIRSGSAERYQHFGRVRTSGALMYADWARIGSDSRAFVLLAIATGGVSGIDQWYLDGKPVEVNGAGWVQTDPWKGRVRLRLRSGRDGEYSGGDWADLQAAFPMRWTGAHRLDGVATILGEFSAVKPENVSDVYPGGRPPEISAVIRGAACWEPATGAASFTDNPIRHLLHYLCAEGMGTIPASEFDLAVCDAARIACNDALPTAGGTRPRYIGGGTVGPGRASEGRRGADPAERGRRAVSDPDRADRGAGRQVSGAHGGDRQGQDRVDRLRPRQAGARPDHRAGAGICRAVARLHRDDGRSVGGCPRYLPLRGAKAARAAATLGAAPRPGAGAGEDRGGAAEPAADGQRRLALLGAAALRQGAGLPALALARHRRGADAGHGPVARSRCRRWRGQGRAGKRGGRILQLDRGAGGGAAFVAAARDQQPARDRGSGDHRRERSKRGDQRDGRAGRWLRCQGAVPADGRALGRAGGQPGDGVLSHPPLVDGVTYEIRARWVLAGLAAVGGSGDDLTRRGPWTEVSGIVAIANGTPPAQPVLVSASRSGNTITIVFQPDLGANYALTQIRRGAAFAGAQIVRTVRDQASTVTVRITDAPPPETYWLRSGNGSGITSDPLNIGTF